MRRITTNVGVWVLFGALFLSQFATAQNPPGPSSTKESVLLTAEGKVETAPAGSTGWAIAQTNQVLHVGDRLRTGLRSRATVRLSNLTVLRVNELTTLQIQPSSEPGKQSALDLKNGAAYFFSRERPTEMEFRTPLASGAIRGTEFNLAVADDGRSEVTLIDGAVTLTNNLGSVSLTNAEQGVVEPGKAPTKTAVINAINIIQWCLYYPAVLDPDDLKFTDAEKQMLAPSLDAYRSGDLLAALARYPANREPVSDSEQIYFAALLLSVGQVDKAENVMAPSLSVSPAVALRELISAVKRTAWKPTTPVTGSDWLARSYREQADLNLKAALDAAKKATEQSPTFGFAWARLAELEFSFGHNSAALEALDKSLQLSPRNAQALSFKGFLLAAKNKPVEALEFFDRAIAVDPALGNAWLGHGLMRIHQCDPVGGLQDLQVAATLEPNRAILRSYLGKAFANEYDVIRAQKELNLAQRLDQFDPTAWLYLALLDEQENRINDAIRNLEKSKELNDNRRLFRSKMLLDQDRAVRSANLAVIYQEAGMDVVSFNEASRAVNYDYANFSAHQFLANSFDALRDPNQINLRYETPWFSELFISQLLAPVGAGNLSQYVSQQEYSRLFETDGLGLSSSTEYRSTGDWLQRGSQYGVFGNFSYSFDAEYRSQDSDRPNSDLEQQSYYLRAKQQLTPQDSVLIEAQLYNNDFGDVAQYYNQNGNFTNSPAPSRTFRANEKEEPNLFIGYHHEWAPGSHTLFLAGRLNDTLKYKDPNGNILFYRYTSFTREPFSIFALPFDVDYHRSLDAYTAELQQIWQGYGHTIIAGGRYQFGTANTIAEINNPNNFPTLVSHQNIDTELQRITGYAYDYWQPIDQLLLVGGVSYDRLRFPRDIDTLPITSAEKEVDQVSPKAGIIWTPLPDTHLRGAYTRSLGGVFFDTSIRLEPTEVAGFNQAFRSIAPESVVGLVPATRFETWGVGFDQAFKKTGTYLTIEGQILSSDATRTVGVLTNSGFPVPDSPSNTRQAIGFRERSVTVTLNQLVSRDWAFGASYRLSYAELNGKFVDIPATNSFGNVAGLNGANAVNQNNSARLNQLNLYTIYSHPCGFFSKAEALWWQQANIGYTPRLRGDDFWQVNLFAGYRFYHRRAEVQLGLLNLTDQDYRINPLNLYYQLPRQRTLSVLFNFYF